MFTMGNHRHHLIEGHAHQLAQALPILAPIAPGAATSLLSAAILVPFLDMS